MKLSFELLLQKVDEYVAQTERQRPGALERVAFWLGWLGAGFALASAALLGRWLPISQVLLFAKVGFFIEIGGFAISLLLMLYREVPKLWRARRAHAVELDADYRSFLEVVAWLNRFPSDERVGRLRFVRDLKGRMSYRLGLALGGIERLGIFPVLIALYLQFKDWRWGDWAALANVNLVAGFLVWTMVLLYGVGWLLVSLKVRLDTYESLLAESLHHEPDRALAV